MILNQSTNLEQFGFRLKSAGAHTSRTIMLPELNMLLNAVSAPEASFQDYASAVLDDNCLQKRSVSNRERTLDNLRILYGLDDKITIFRILKKLYMKYPESLPQNAFLCATTRDQLLRELTPWVLAKSEGTVIDRLKLEKQIAKLHPDRFSPVTLTSTSQNINATWTQAGFLTGRSRKVRIEAQPSPISVTYALLLGFLCGAQGMRLFESEFVSYLDSPKENLINLAEIASRMGLLRLKRIGDVVEVDFDSILNSVELEMIYV
ncbi:MAG: hypothetical protein PHW20_01245 [Clostridia bacterium]|nr:hypothetical protein [Clostridia bacterium]